MYLAGYAVECGLKALILKWTSKHEFTKVLADLTEVGRKGHEFEYLKGLIKIRMGKRGATDREAFARLAEYFGLVATWTPALRYESGNRDPEVARDMIKAAQNIYEWCERG
jgi:hypothetical protein